MRDGIYHNLHCITATCCTARRSVIMEDPISSKHGGFARPGKMEAYRTISGTTEQILTLSIMQSFPASSLPSWGVAYLEEPGECIGVQMKRAYQRGISRRYGIPPPVRRREPYDWVTQQGGSAGSISNDQRCRSSDSNENFSGMISKDTRLVTSGRSVQWLDTYRYPCIRPWPKRHTEA